ncbi:MAG: ATP-binding protein [Candidatus Marinimicrobia bacterium]|nr:ATP-binding protein [Candidatus Neomarinimicrobiota bacterium]
MKPGKQSNPPSEIKSSQRDRIQEIKDYTTTVTILESITDAIFILNVEGKIEYANQSAQEYLQLPLESVIGMDLGSFITSDDGEIQQLLHSGSRFASSDSGIEPDYCSSSEAELSGGKQQIPVLINFSSIPDSKGSLKYFIVTAKEIAYRKSLEMQLKNRQVLSVSFDRLKVLGEMSVGLVHTLGQPVTAMKLRLDHIAQLTSLDEVQKQVRELHRDIERLSAIVEKVRSYAQVMADKQTSSVDINDIVHSMLQILDYDLSQANIVLELDLSDSLPFIVAHVPELEQVFLNLLTNAMQAFQVNQITGEQNISISTRNIEEKWVEIGIQDNAGGIPESISTKMFEPFFSTWDESRHAGTGLSVARSIVASLGGDLKYIATESGSCFKMRIPIVQSEERAQLINMIELLNS